MEVSEESAKTFLNVGQAIKGRTEGPLIFRVCSSLAISPGSKQVQSIVKALQNRRQRRYICGDQDREMPQVPESW